MKRALVIGLVLTSMTAYTYAEQKIAVVNPQKILVETIRGKQVKERLEKISNEKQAEIQKKEAAIKALEKELMSPALNPETRESKAADLQSRQVDIKRFVEDSQKEFQRRYQKEMETLYKEIMPVIQQIGKAQGYTLILDLSSAGVSYFDTAIDITDEVIRAYDEKYKAK
ncbi:MAG TPA: OmpH family outer membrane protein [Candidatus Aminicenantes bacterium]|nr:OmpH family outer membrane protein [Candidatus Aminicenantes bacterium]